MVLLLKQLIVSQVPHYTGRQFGIVSIFLVGIIMAWSINDYHFFELSLLDFLCDSRCTLVAFEALRSIEFPSCFFV